MIAAFESEISSINVFNLNRNVIIAEKMEFETFFMLKILTNLDSIG
jgi:hypothetical protein